MSTANIENLSTFKNFINFQQSCLSKFFFKEQQQQQQQKKSTKQWRDGGRSAKTNLEIERERE